MDSVATNLDPDAVRLRVSVTAGSARLSLHGELDRESGDLLHRLVGEVLHDRAPETLELDASGLTFVDSSGIRWLLTCLTRAGSAGSRLAVLDPSPVAYQVLQITGLLGHFAIEERPDLSARPSRPGSGQPRPA